MKRYRGIICLVMIVSLSMFFPGCATSGPKEPVQTHDYSRFKGYMIRIGEIKAGTFETPPYIPTKIRFELEQDLREKRLLASEGDKNTLTVNIVSSTYYNFWPREHVRLYTELRSIVEVVDTSRPEVIAKTTIVSYNAWGANTADFTEMDNGRDIVKFLENIVR
jgi:hypothetical protein